jgi:hypothetical protein
MIMSRNVGTITIACMVLVTLAFGGSRSKKGAVLGLSIDREPSARVENRAASGSSSLEKTSAITWVIVDSMNNAFGPASTDLRPMSYDSALNIVAVIHRAHLGYGTASGQLWYNISKNGGTTWRRVSELNAGLPTDTRYPSGTILNATNSTDTSNVLFVWAAPLLAVGGAGFGRAMWGFDFPFGGGSSVAYQEDGLDFWSSLPIWTGGPWAYWICYRGTQGTTTSPNDFKLWRTTDYGTISSGIPTTWQATSWLTGDFHLDIGGFYRNASYLGAWGVFAGEAGVVDNIGYSKSTDNGATWSAWTKPSPDWRSVPGLGLNYDWWAFGPIGGGLDFQMVVDANNRAHFFGVVQDTLTLARSVVEVYETPSGWNGKIIQPDLKESTLLVYGALNQTGHHLQVAMNKAGTVISLVWLDAATQGETLPDIWESHRHINGNWSTPQNLTQTPTLAELLLHCAPVMRANGSNGYTMFLGRTYQIGTPPYPPDDTQPAYFYVGTNTFTQLPVAVEEGTTTPSAYRLEQNYPNPFNPSTRIAYALPSRSHVRLAVYNVLGQEVETLVDEFKEAGRYEATFDATGLSSGVYFYSLSAGQYADTKKLLLVR